MAAVMKIQNKKVRQTLTTPHLHQNLLKQLLSDYQSVSSRPLFIWAGSVQNMSLQNQQEVHVPELEGVGCPEVCFQAAPPVVMWSWRVVLELCRPEKRGSSQARELGEIIKVIGLAQRYTLVNTGSFTGNCSIAGEILMEGERRAVSSPPSGLNSSRSDFSSSFWLLLSTIVLSTSVGGLEEKPLSHYESWKLVQKKCFLTRSCPQSISEEPQETQFLIWPPQSWFQPPLAKVHH